MDKILKAIQLANVVISLIAQAEAIKKSGKSLSGDDKKKMVQDQILLAVQTSGMVISNNKEFQKNLNKAVDGLVGMFNSSVWAD